MIKSDSCYAQHLENKARESYDQIQPENLSRMGGCIEAIPNSDELADYLSQLRQIWVNGWSDHPDRYPHLLLKLYHCVAFLRYEGNAFWTSFGELTGDKWIADDGNKQGSVNRGFAKTAEKLRLNILVGTDRSRHLYVQSAVRHVGIPVRIWRGFVEICEKLRIEEEDWGRWQDGRWEDAMMLWLGGRKNLRKFFVENRQTATKWLNEMFEARRILEENPDWTLDDVAGTSFLRQEYFDEVPETATFLRPIDTDSLFRDRPRLRWKETQPGMATLRLETPRLTDGTLLPADWIVCEQRDQASTNPRAIRLDSRAFTNKLLLTLDRDGTELKSYKLSGISPWGLWSESSESFISPQTHELPMGHYQLLSNSPLCFTDTSGWLQNADEETHWNQEYQMPDGTACFVSQLIPEERRAVLEVEGWHRIVFAPRSRLEVRVFPRPTERFFLQFLPPNTISLPEWPHFILKMPKGLLANSVDETDELLNREFRLFAENNRVQGKWLHDEDASKHLDDEDIFFFKIVGTWKPPSFQSRPTQILTNLNDLGRIEPSQPEPGHATFQLRANRHGVIPFANLPEVRVNKELSPAWWEKLKFSFGDYWPWHALTATQDYATWEEIRLAFDLMNFGSTKLRFYPFQQIERERMAVRRGHRWTDFENRILFGEYESGVLNVSYSGLTDAIYSILREFEPIDPIEAEWGRGHPPFLRMRFSLRDGLGQRIQEACCRDNICIRRGTLWNH